MSEVLLEGQGQRLEVLAVEHGPYVGGFSAHPELLHDVLAAHTITEMLK